MYEIHLSSHKDRSGKTLLNSGVFSRRDKFETHAQLIE